MPGGQPAFGAQPGMPGAQPGMPGAQPGMPGAQPGMPGAAPNPYAAANPYANFPGARRAGGVPKGAAVGGAVLLVIGGIAAAGVKSYLIKSQGMASAKDVGVDPKKADVVQMIEGTKPLARKWRSDAEFYSINVNGWKSDGTVDLTDGGTVTVTYYSPSRVKSASAKGREDSIKKFVFNGSDVNYKSLWKATNPWKGVDPTPVPKCTAKKLAAQLKDDDVDLAKDAILAIDPTWGQAWHVISGSKVNRWFDLGDCSELKLKAGGGDDSTGAGADE
jgi:hypothetical protein